MSPVLSTINTSLGSSLNNITITIIVNNVPIEGTLDTAAQITVVNDKCFQTLNLKLSRKQVMLKQADGGSTIIATVIPNVALQIGSFKLKMDIYVAKISDPLLLGLDFMLKAKAILDLQTNVMTVPGCRVPINVINASRGNIQTLAYATTNTKLAPGQDKNILLSSTDNGREDSIVLFTPDNKWNSLCLPLCLVAVNKKNRYINVKNMSDKSVFLHQGVVLGTLEPVDICEHAPTEQASAMLSKITKSIDLPEHMTEMYARSITLLNAHEQQLFKNLLLNYVDIFSSHDLDIGCYTGLQHSIDTGNTRPLKQRIRRTPVAFQNEEEAHLKKMIEMGIIEPSNSEWASPPVLVRKRSGTVRYCIDYRFLNDATRKDAFPLPLIEECFDALDGVQFLSTTDLSSGYFQLMVSEQDRHKTAFITKYGLFQFRRLAMGLCNAPATFQRAMSQVLAGLNWKTAIIYLDDLIVVGKSFRSHLNNLKDVFDRLRRFNLKVSPRKCQFMRHELKFLGWIVGRNGISIPPENTMAIKSRRPPISTQEVESFLGYINYHRSHVKNFAEIATPLYALTGQKARKVPFVWTNTHQEVFEKLVTIMTTAPVMRIPNKTDLFILDVDASNIAIGAELLQLSDGEEYVVAYASFSLTAIQKRYCTTRKELLAIVRFTRHFRHYLLGREFVLRTDHGSLTWLMRFKNADGQLARWLEELSQYDMIIKHRAGKHHTNADYLSRPTGRNNCDNFDRTLKSLPCGGCSYCTKVQKQWASFFEEVDDVVPLTSSVIPNNNQKQPRMCNITVTNDKPNWCSTHDLEEIIHSQQIEPEFVIILSWLEDGIVPSQQELALHSAECKFYWRNKHCFSIIEGILYIVRRNETDDDHLLMVPRNMREDILESCHGNIMAGHLSSRKSLQLLARQFYWWGMARDCDLFVKSCTECNRSKKANRHYKTNQVTYHAGFPMERVHIDLLGPFPDSQSGNKYVFMIIDQFTKWVECYPLPDQGANTVARALVDNFIARFGSPCIIHSDQGRQFESDLFTALCTLLEIKKTRTSSYHPCSNGQIERYNRTLMSLIRAHLEGDSQNWDINIPLLAGAIRGMVNRQTGFTANMMMLGRETKRPIEHILGKPTELPDKPNCEYVRHLASHMRTVHLHAREQLKTSLKIQKDDYDKNIFSTTYKPGDMVYRKNLAFHKGQSKKTEMPWVGPLLVIEQLSSVTYRVRSKRRILVVHHDNIKPCHDKLIPNNLQILRERLLRKLPLDGIGFDDNSTAEFWDLVDPNIDNNSAVNTRVDADPMDTSVDSVANDTTVIPERTRVSTRIRTHPSHLRVYDCEY